MNMENITAKENNPEKSEMTRRIIEQFKELRRTAQANRGKANELHIPYSLEMKAFIDMLVETMDLEDLSPRFLAEAILPMGRLEEMLQEIDSESKLKGKYQAGYRMQIAPIPFSYSGESLSEGELIEGEHIGMLTCEDHKNGQTISGYSQFPNYIHHLLPKEMQKSSFLVGPYEKEGIFDVSDTDRENLKKQLTESWERMQNSIIEAASL